MNTITVYLKKIIEPALLFSPTHIQNGNISINYDNIRKVVLFSKSEILNAVPMGDDFFFQVSSNENKIEVKFRSRVLNIGSNKLIEAFNVITKITMLKIVPSVINNLITDLSTKAEPIEIGDLIINLKRIKKIRLVRKPKIVELNKLESIAFNNGEVDIYFRENNKRKYFSSVKLEEPNSILLPYLIPKILQLSNSSS